VTVLGSIFIAAPLFLLLAARRILIRRGRQGRDHALSLGCAAIGLAVWPSQNALLFDRVVHVPGLAHVLTDTFIPLTFLLLFKFTSTLRQQWPRLRGPLLRAGGVFVALHAGFWLIDEVTVPGDHTSLFYGHYYGRPVQLLITYILLGTSIVFSASLCMRGYFPSLAAGYPTRERLVAGSVAAIAGGAAIYGTLIPVQVIANATGHGSSGITALTVPIMSTTALVATLTAGMLLYGRRVVQYVRDLVSNKRQFELMRLETVKQQQEHERHQQRMISLSMMLNDSLLRVRQDYSAAQAVEAVANQCVHLCIARERRKIAIEATRILSLHFDNVTESPFFDDDELDDTKGLTEYFALHILDGSFFYDHVYKVAILALSDNDGRTDMALVVDVEDWHRELARIVAGALRDWKGNKWFGSEAS